MVELRSVAQHYTHGHLIDAIRAAMAALSKTPDTITVDDLSPLDEFHIGGRKASADLLGQLGFSAERHVLDVGCGLGGAARFVASRYCGRVTGIDLTAEYIETGKTLSEWTGLADRVSLRQGSALSMPFPDNTFDGSYMMHVGMNIADKAKLFSEVHRVLRSRTLFGIYDVMKVGDGELTYPVPWAAAAEMNAVAGPDQYKRALQDAGFAVTAERNRRDFALQFFEQLLAKTAAAAEPPPLGLQILMGKSAPIKVQNMIANIAADRIAPVELIARKV